MVVLKTNYFCTIYIYIPNHQSVDEMLTLFLESIIFAKLTEASPKLY